MRTGPTNFLADGHSTSPAGWSAGVAACGIKYPDRNDLALLVSEHQCVAAALFTKNRVKSAHILYDTSILARSPTAIRGVVINSGNANACTGEAGLTDARTMARAAEDTLHLPESSMLVMSTGVIGIRLPIEAILRGITAAASHLDPKGGRAAAQAIMTTDTRPKHAAITVSLSDGHTITIGGMSKGAGMIHPNMATMLGILTTDAAITHSALQTSLHYVADRSFHAISVDGDTSTNDTLLIMANGLAGNHPITSIQTPDGQEFLSSLLILCQYLAKEIVRDGEGATKLIEITVSGAQSREQAHQAAMTIARSPLVKTAFFGADPNWGRIICALGYSGVEFVPEQCDLSICGIPVFAQGVPLPFDEHTASTLLANASEVTVVANLHLGNGEATVWTCDFSYEYVRINAEYRT